MAGDGEPVAGDGEPADGLRIDGVRVVPWRRRVQVAVADGRNVWSERRGWFVVVERDGARGIGEAAPLPGFGESVSAADARWSAIGFALETAILDAQARRRGVPFARVLSGSPVTRVPVNAVVHDVDGARAAVARGIHTIKVKVGADHERTLATLREIRGALPGITLRVDANQSWPLPEVESRLRELVGLRLQYVEEPAAGLAPTLESPLPVPIALDESLAAPDCNVWLHHALHSGALAALVLKPTVLGGVLICQHLAERARAHRIAVNITHALEGPVAMAACAALALALAPEHAVGLDRHAFLDTWPTLPPHLAADAIVDVDVPGLGLDIDALLAAAVADADARGETCPKSNADAERDR